MDRFTFWYRWLLCVSVGFGLFGVMVAVWPAAPPLAPWHAGADAAFYGGSAPAEALPFRAFILGPLGATIAGFYVLQTFIVATAFRRRERWAWQAIAAATLVWFVVDSAVSVAHGAWFNVLMINLTTLLLVGLPLAMTYRAFPAASGGSR
jgi:hypothetical protein